MKIGTTEVGGPQGGSYYRVGKSLLPEVIVIEGEPTGFPRAPFLSKRRIYFDVGIDASSRAIHP